MTSAAPPSQAGSPSSLPIPYGSFSARFRALVLDAAVMFAAVVAILIGAALTPTVPGTGRVAVVALLSFFLLYEPVMVARFGWTLGHRWANLRVVSEASDSNPGFWRALARFLIKSLLGLPSFTFMALSRRHQALHDRVAGTTVRLRDMDRARDIDVVWERSDAELEPPDIPSRPRRILVVLAYLVAIFIAVVLAAATTLPDACLLEERCTPGEKLRFDGLVLGWFAVSALCIIVGWRGRLWGARARQD